MNEDVTRQQVEAAMQARIDDGRMFRLRDLTAIGIAMTNARYVRDRGAYMPVSRVADQLCQKNRKADRIWFQSGWWELRSAATCPPPSGLAAGGGA